MGSGAGGGAGGGGVGAGGDGSGGVGTRGVGEGALVPVWSMPTFTPAIVAFPVRPADVFGVTLKRTTAFPTPLDGMALPSHESLLSAFHAQPVVAATLNVASPPALSTLRRGGVTS